VSEESEINIFACLDFLRDNAKLYAKAKAERIYLEEYRKAKKAILMQQAELGGCKTSANQERDAYAHPEYVELLKGLQEAVEREESLRWLLVSAQAKIEAWRTLSASQRYEASKI
jgi:hypothetical protein